MTWITPDVERSESYVWVYCSRQRIATSEPPAVGCPDFRVRNRLSVPLAEHRAILLRKCAGMDAGQLATRAVPPSKLSLLGLVRHMSDTERGWVRQTYRGHADLIREVIDGSAGL